MRLSLLIPAVLSLALPACFDTPAGDSTSSGSSSGSVASTDDGPASCVPGQLQPCNCPSGMGNQVCNDAGDAYGPCECAPGDTGDTGPVADTGNPGSSSGGDSTGAGSDSTGEGSTGSGEESGTTMAIGDSGEGSSGPPPGPLSVGEECGSDADCMTNICWDFNDYDPFCFGSACSVSCTTNDECVAAMAAAGAPNPGASTCGADGRCATLGTGFGAYACAGPS